MVALAAYSALEGDLRLVDSETGEVRDLSVDGDAPDYLERYPNGFARSDVPAPLAVTTDSGMSSGPWNAPLMKGGTV